VEKDSEVHGLNREDATDHSRWRKQIFDDHDGHEWVNVSSGNGSPGQNPKSCKMVMCCVCVHGNNCLLKFADVTYLILPASNTQTCLEELANIQDWATKNNLRFNCAKSTEIIFRSCNSHSMISF